MRKVLVFIGSRANYGSIKSCIKAIDDHENLELLLVVGGSAVLEKFGNVSKNIEDDGFNIHEKIFFLFEGGDQLSMAKSTGVALIELANSFSRLQPDLVLTIGDRYETMATVLAATYLNIPLAHTMGGEVSGTIDESIRHAITKFASIHFTANSDASERVIKMGEFPKYVHTVGCPRIDLVASSIDKFTKLNKQIFINGVGIEIDFNKSFLLVSQHPVTTEYSNNRKYMDEILKALTVIGMPALILWPNSDAGSDGISKSIRIWREQNPEMPFRYCKNLDSSIYFYLMSKCKALIGNSSSGIREGAFIGTPVVNIGSRQNGRVRSSNVIDVNIVKSKEIISAIKQQIKHGKYDSSTLYGDGKAGAKIAELIDKQDKFQTQKIISY